ncbi:hypothetical protein A2955_05100 [Candidatus Woesebacteria bacterium RIFCSPLOWO2_01_FULL_37_19]|uniref:Uncharacterized protein n=2 Tax=Candidatus Woeseibacteriota TaxID=1752722 RepID=A0A1F8AZZ5_9BACT|nr:MAG: hypothetical protein A2771_03305 [Candidatus Woesebacteria bacterium RIFCSPHIGHO2_01_FULL_38_26b]OGM57343.1 MAG: hypothetical protein A2955_05100 [Candidatus Woesebacteria bacterium RIFCSPLOWO2_01_FULL_37_19]
MSYNLIEIADKFIEYINSYDRKSFKHINQEPNPILFRLLTAAGFENRNLIIGNLRGFNRDQDGSVVGYYDINEYSPYIVQYADGRDDNFATGWLDSVIKFVLFNTDKTRPLDEQLIKVIKSSKPLTPIQ